MSNILITSAGRRVSLIKCFKEASKKFNTGSKIFITDLGTTVTTFMTEHFNNISTETHFLRMSQ